MNVRFVVLALSVSIGSLAFAQPGARPAPTLARPVDDPAGAALVREIIQTSVVVVAGQEFPKTQLGATGTSSPLSSCCNPGDTRKRDVLFKKQFTGYNENKNKQYGPYVLIEGTDKCWVISGYQRVELSAAGKYSASVSHQPAGFQLIQSSSYTNEYSNIHNYLLTLKLPKSVEASLDIKLNTFVKNYSAFSQSIDTSHAIVQHEVTLWGAGMFNGRSWYDGYVNISETCCPPEVRDPAALRATLKAWVDDVAKKYKKKVFDTALSQPVSVD